MKEVYLLLGSNEGDRIRNLKEAEELIAQRCGKLVHSSSLYETEAWGLKEQSSFLNQAIMMGTSLSAKDLLSALKAIEKAIGRTKTIKWGPRVIDIDIIFYGNDVVDLPDLKIPHPFMQERKFTLAALNEIAPNIIHPVLKKKVSEMLDECSDESKVTIHN